MQITHRYEEIQQEILKQSFDSLIVFYAERRR